MSEDRRFITVEQFDIITRAINALQVSGVANCMAVAQVGQTLIAIGEQKIEAPQPDPGERAEAPAAEPIPINRAA